MSKSIRQFISFSLVGILNTLLDFIIYYGLSRWFAINFLIANAAAFFCSVSFSYFVNKRLTFNNDDKIILKQYLKYVLVSMFTLVIVEMLLFTGVKVFALNDLVVKLLATGISLILNFTFSKKLVFKQ